jgi:coenzyme F420 biosynthesis associated uncharacterized protein
LPDPIDWNVAMQLAAKLAGSDPFATSYHAASLQPDFDEFTQEAEELVAQATGLRSMDGPARARVATRQQWTTANVASFQRLFRPLTDRLGEHMDGLFAPASRAVAGVEVGTLLGWMSKRVLGQYDLMVAPDNNPEDQDVVYYVGANVLAMEKRFGFPPREFRLWLSIHEVTHRAQFTGVPWMRAHYLDLLKTTLESADPDPKHLIEALKRAAGSLLDGKNPLSDGGIVTLLANPTQRVALEDVGGLMSLLEGHGDITMDRAGGGRIPSASRFSQALSQRRDEVKGAARVVRQAIGMEAKLRQYQDGERFIAAIERTRGASYFDRVWESRDRLPTLAEIRDPERWIRRIDLLSPSTA